MTVTKTHSAGAPDWRDAAAIEYRDNRAELVRQRARGLKAIERMQKRLGEIDENISDLDRGAKAFGLAMPEVTLDRKQAAVRAAGDEMVRQAALLQERLGPDAKVFNSASDRVFAVAGVSRQFKDVALKLLADAYPAPLKAAEVQHHAQIELGREFHWKTAGMTLYRLKNEFKVRRQGQDWFFVPEDQREEWRAHEEVDPALAFSEALGIEPSDEPEDEEDRVIRELLE